MERNASHNFMKSANACLLFLVVVIFTPLLVACGAADGNSQAGNLAQADTGKGISVETHVLRTGSVVNIIKATGTVFPRHDALVASQTSGTITAIYISLGDPVTKGEPLIQVDDELKQLALEQAEAKLLEAKAAFEKANRDLERNKKLHAAKDISDYIFENVRLQKESAEALYLGTQAQVKIARRQLRDTRIVSPLNGIVAQVPVELGNSVGPGTLVARIVDISKVKVKLGIAQRDIAKVTKGKQTSLFFDAFPGTTFEGAVTAVGPQADLSTRTFPVEISVENSKYRLRGGMIARVEILAETVPNATLLPRTAILERAGKTLIFVVENGVALLRLAKFGLEKGDEVVLLEGAKPGAEVVVSGQENLIDGSLVRIKNQSR